MDNLEFINIDLFKQSYYKGMLPLTSINDFLKDFDSREIDAVTKTLISIFELPISPNNELRKVGAVLLYSDDASSDMEKISSYILHNLEYTAK